MKIPRIGVVNYNKTREKNLSNNASNPAFKGRVDTEMRKILVERPIVANIGHSGYTTYYYEEIVGSRVDELNRMVNVYRPYSWEQTTPMSSLGTPNFSTYTILPKETMFDQASSRYQRQGCFINPYGFSCDIPDLKPDKQIPDYLESKAFRLIPPMKYTDDGRPIYKTGEPLYRNDEYGNKEIKEVRKEIWQGAIGEIGKPLNRLESLEDKLNKLENIYKNYSDQRNKIYRYYDSLATLAKEKGANAFGSKTTSDYYKFSDVFEKISYSKAKPFDDMKPKLESNIKQLKEEIKTIKDAKARNQYIDLSTKELYENTDIVKTAEKLSKNEHYRDVYVSLPDRTYCMQWLCYNVNKDWDLSDEKLLRKYIDKIMYPEIASNIPEGLVNREENSKCSDTRTDNKDHDKRVSNTLIKH